MLEGLQEKIEGLSSVRKMLGVLVHSHSEDCCCEECLVVLGVRLQGLDECSCLCTKLFTYIFAMLSEEASSTRLYAIWLMSTYKDFPPVPDLLKETILKDNDLLVIRAAAEILQRDYKEVFNKFVEEHQDKVIAQFITGAEK